MFCTYAETQFNLSVQTVRSDNGMEFMCLREYFQDKGIIHQTSCVYTPQQNGRVERKHRHILNVARALLFQANMPTKFWGEAISTATHLINMTPSKVLDGSSPYEKLFGVKPAYETLRVFGSLCYVHRRDRTKEKLGERSRKCVFMGYPFGKKGWRVYDLESNEFLVSRDVSFTEDEFPFAGHNSGVIESKKLTGEPDDDWVINMVVEDRGSKSQSSNQEETVVEVSSHGTPNENVISNDMVEEVESESKTVAENEVVAEPELGRGCREKVSSVRLKDYVSYNAQYLREQPHHDLTTPAPQSEPSSTGPGNTPYPIENYISDERFSPDHKAFLAAITNEREPRSYKEAAQQKIWRDSMQKEIVAFEENKTFSVVNLPPDKKAIGNMWIYKYKYNADGTMERPKSRLVALGNKQVKDRDFKETFAPVAKMTTIRSLLRVVAGKGWIVHQMDVHNAFLHGDLKEEVYMKLPQGFKHYDPNKLHKVVYGLRQAPRCWYAKLTDALKRYGFKNSYADYSLFVYSKKGIELRVLIYVDDLLVCGNDMEFVTKFKNYLSRCFHMKDLGKLKYFLGIEVGRGEESFMLSQRKYALDLIFDVGLLGARPVATPMEQHHKLGLDKSPFLVDVEKYIRLVGRLIYLSIMRPDISYSVHILSQFMKTPREVQWDAALRVVKYLKGTPGQGIMLSSKSDLSLSVYCDADWSACPLTRRSLSAYVTLVGDSPVSWKTKKQGVVSHSSTESEYRSMAQATREVKWLRRLLDDLGAKQLKPSKMYYDSKSAIYIAANPVFHERTKHIESDCHQVRDAIQDGLLETVHVRTTEQVADVLTKALGKAQFEALLFKLGVRNFNIPNLRGSIGG